MLYDENLFRQWELPFYRFLDTGPFSPCRRGTWLVGITGAIQGHIEFDSKSMAADFDAIVKEAGWPRCHRWPVVQKSRFLPAIWMK